MIIANTHDFFNENSYESFSSNSARNFFGVADGAFLSSPNGFFWKFKKDFSPPTTEHLQLCNLRDARALTSFRNYEESHLGFQHLGISQLSALLLKGINYKKVGETRRDNDKTLEKNILHSNQLDSNCFLKFHFAIRLSWISRSI